VSYAAESEQKTEGKSFKLKCNSLPDHYSGSRRVTEFLLSVQIVYQFTFKMVFDGLL